MRPAQRSAGALPAKAAFPGGAAGAERQRCPGVAADRPGSATTPALCCRQSSNVGTTLLLETRLSGNAGTTLRLFMINFGAGGRRLAWAGQSPLGGGRVRRSRIGRLFPDASLEQQVGTQAVAGLRAGRPGPRVGSHRAGRAAQDLAAVVRRRYGRTGLARLRDPQPDRDDRPSGAAPQARPVDLAWISRTRLRRYGYQLGVALTCELVNKAGVHGRCRPFLAVD